MVPQFDKVMFVAYCVLAREMDFEHESDQAVGLIFVS